MKLFDFQTHKEACLNHSDMVCKHCLGQLQEISCVPVDAWRSWEVKPSQGGYQAAFASAEQQGSSFTHVKGQCHIPTRFLTQHSLPVKHLSCAGSVARVLKARGKEDPERIIFWGSKPVSSECQVSWAGCTRSALPVCASLLPTPSLHCPRAQCSADTSK